MSIERFYAHTSQSDDESSWQPLLEHLVLTDVMIGYSHPG
jgi:hypothetical protein